MYLFNLSTRCEPINPAPPVTQCYLHDVYCIILFDIIKPCHKNYGKQ